jgi:hypothetical protein
METACKRIMADIERDRNDEQAEIAPKLNELLLAIPRMQDLRELDARMAAEFKQAIHSKREPLQPLLDDRLRAAQSLASFRRTARIVRGATQQFSIGHVVAVVGVAALEWLTNTGLLSGEVGIFQAGAVATGMLATNTGLACTAAAFYRLRNDPTPGTKGDERRASAGRKFNLAVASIVMLNLGFSAFRAYLHVGAVGEMPWTTYFVSALLFLVGIGGAAAAGVLAYVADDAIPEYGSRHRADVRAKGAVAREHAQLELLRGDLFAKFSGAVQEMRTTGYAKVKEVDDLLDSFAYASHTAEDRVQTIFELKQECCELYQSEYLSMPRHPGAPRLKFLVGQYPVLNNGRHHYGDFGGPRWRHFQELERLEGEAVVMLRTFDDLMGTAIDEAVPEVDMNPPQNGTPAGRDKPPHAPPSDLSATTQRKAPPKQAAESGPQLELFANGWR